MRYLDRYYLAYGSNMNTDEMKLRCPFAKLHKVDELKDYELQFRGGNGTAYLTVEPKEGSSVYVALWKVTDHDKTMLDYYEGYHKLYHIEKINLKFDDKTYPCFMYVMNGGYGYELPTMNYYHRCMSAYKHLGLDGNSLKHALDQAIERSWEMWK